MTRGLDLLLAFRGLLGDDQLDPDELRVAQSVLKGFEANQIEFDHADASANRPESFQSTFSQLRKSENVAPRVGIARSGILGCFL